MDEHPARAGTKLEATERTVKSMFDRPDNVLVEVVVFLQRLLAPLPDSLGHRGYFPNLCNKEVDENLPDNLGPREYFPNLCNKEVDENKPL